LSPNSEAIESLARRYGVPALDALEFFLERAAIREYDGGISRLDAEAAAIGDVEIWAKLWIRLKGEKDPQLGLPSLTAGPEQP
jgi:hypothetical protein